MAMTVPGSLTAGERARLAISLNECNQSKARISVVRAGAAHYKCFAQLLFAMQWEILFG